MAEVFDEFTVVTDESKEALYFTEVFHGRFPLSNGIHFSGIDSDGAVGDDVAKVFDMRGGEVTFLEFAVPLVVAKAFEYEVDVTGMCFNVGRINEDVIEVNYYEVV